MRLKLKLVAMASAVALAGSLVVAFAGPAAALPAGNQNCAFMLSGLVGCWFTYPDPGSDVPLCIPVCGNFWHIPAVNADGHIAIAAANGHGNVCMQYVAEDPYDDTNLLLKQCNSKIAAQEWYRLPAAESGTYEYENGANGLECLNAKYYVDQNGILNVAPCSANANNIDEEWAPNENPPTP
jgi:hypothetical protein